MRQDVNEYELSYSGLLGRDGGLDMMHVRREIKYGQKAEGNNFSLFIGRFNSIDMAKRARVVRWNYGMDEDDRAGLV